MRILVLVENYTTNDGIVSMHYVHTRNLIYKENGININVLSFKAKQSYTLDGIKVYTERDLIERLNCIDYDILLSHAPNIKNHLRFINRFGKLFNKIVYYFHGHEILKISKFYPKPYKYIKTRFYIKPIRDIYDVFKLFIWRYKLLNPCEKSKFIFVSNYMIRIASESLKVNSNQIKNRYIIYNSVGKMFEKKIYDLNRSKEFNFITIRNNLDEKHNCIDIITKLATKYNHYKFCVIGTGDYFNHYSKPENLIWIDKNLSHNEIIEFLNISECALLPTRTDTQGVMGCEMATFGIPLITSDLDVCKEVFSGFKNVAFISNNIDEINLEYIYNQLIHINDYEKNERYFARNTILKEIEVFKEVIS